MVKIHKQEIIMLFISIIPVYLSKDSSKGKRLKDRKDMNVHPLSYQQLYQKKPSLYEYPYLHKSFNLHRPSSPTIRRHLDFDSFLKQTYKQEPDYHQPEYQQPEYQQPDYEQSYYQQPKPPERQSFQNQPEIFKELPQVGIAEQQQQMPQILQKNTEIHRWPDPYRPQHSYINKLSEFPQLMHQPQKPLLVKTIKSKPHNHLSLLKIPYLAKSANWFEQQKLKLTPKIKPLRYTVDNLSEYPFIVLLEGDGTSSEYEDESNDYDIYATGMGTLIAPSWVLTSGSCASGSVIQIRFGDFKAPIDSPNTFSLVLNAIQHPGYRDVEAGIFNDIGLLQVNAVPIDNVARLSAVDYMSLVGHEVLVPGYGKPKTGFTFPLKSNKAAAMGCPREFVVGGPFICVGGLCNDTLRIGYGKRGGPLLYEGRVVGVQSGQVNSIFTYTGMSPYLHWIRILTKENKKKH